jgi:hypothetical protein
LHLRDRIYRTVGELTAGCEVDQQATDQRKAGERDEERIAFHMSWLLHWADIGVLLRHTWRACLNRSCQHNRISGQPAEERFVGCGV